MAVPFTSLNAATATGAGTSRDLGQVAHHHTMIVTATGGATYSVMCEGSHDDVAWFALCQINGSGPGPNDVSVPPVSSPGPGTLVRYVRANLVTLTGGSSPTITATIASDTTGED